MSAPLNNQFWKARAKHGRDKLFETPELLYEAACEYFQWCDDHPLYESKAFAFQGDITIAQMPKLRAYTMDGLCLFLGCTDSYFRSFKILERINKEDFVTVMLQIERTIYNQKFTGAAADLLNANIISRDLGLIDKINNEHTGKDGSAIQNEFTIKIIETGPTLANHEKMLDLSTEP